MVETVTTQDTIPASGTPSISTQLRNYSSTSLASIILNELVAMCLSLQLTNSRNMKWRNIGNILQPSEEEQLLLRRREQKLKAQQEKERREKVREQAVHSVWRVSGTRKTWTTTPPESMFSSVESATGPSSQPWRGTDIWWKATRRKKRRCPGRTNY